MRLHHLQVTAFGPFADEVTVDFDALSDAGLFLLTGATGAGKTSILDAVCFALYGEVPGDRQTAKRLRSDQAAAGVRPSVGLEVTLSGRRFRIDRSPAWERPKKRGSGFTTEQASVRLSERRDGGWHQLANRLDETGHLVTHLVGMNLAQFCQVAMLPQGRFQAFLRARSDERHKLLQQLFRTTRFEDIERWLRDHRRSMRQQSARHHEVVADLVSRVSETADVPLPEVWDLHELTAPADAGEVDRWSGLQRERAAACAAATSDAVRLASDAESRARASLEQAVRLVELQATHGEAMATRDRLRAQGSEQSARLHRLSAARRAASVQPLHELAVRQARACAHAVELAARCTAVVAGLLDVEAESLDARAIGDAGQRAVDAAARTRALQPREDALAELRTAIVATEERVATLASEESVAAARLRDLPTERTRLTAAYAEAKTALLAIPAARAYVDALRRRRQASELAAELTTELARARELHTAAVDELHHRKEEWLHIQQERINGMAAELAGALAVGDDCPVCGSAEHPHLASARSGAPDAIAEKTARKLVDDAESARLAHDGLVRDLVTRIAVAEEQAAGDGDAAAELLAAEAEVERLSTAADDLTGVAAQIERVETELARIAESREGVLLDLAEARAGLGAQQAQAQAIEGELAGLLDGSGAASLAALAAQHDRLVAACDEALAASRAASLAGEAEADARQRAERAAQEAGFADLTAALAAALEAAQVAELETRIRDHDTSLAAAEAVLADPTLRAAAAVKSPDLPSLEEDHERRSEALGAARDAAALARARGQRLAGLVAELRTALEGWAPIRTHLDLATRMAALADGTSPDNRLQMRLSGYVLAWRLAQVVAAANERLAGMSDQRYSLEHTGRRGAGETRGGLSLLIRDDWSGETRDPATLSGGETFVVSLALALGLADVIAHEVGGADLDTLFVDEGFGSLDADTLDDVMDTLDSLRDGGRVVGVVSHVAEMRDRIPVQLRVSKSRHGSTVALAR
jgi:exonuclease SbcC